MESFPTFVIPDDPETEDMELHMSTIPIIDPRNTIQYPSSKTSSRTSNPIDHLPVLDSEPAMVRLDTALASSTSWKGLDQAAPDQEVGPETARPVSTYLSSKDYETMAKRAKLAAKRDRLAGGTKSVLDASMTDIAALGIGLELYFLLLKYLSGAFLTMAVLSVPTIIVNYYGHGVTSKMSDPLQFAYASLGNQGVNPDLASDPSQCLPIGEIDCTGKSVHTPFTSNPITVAWLVTASDALYSLVFLVIFLAFRRHAKRAIATHETDHLTPAKYAICVQNLPSNATVKELLDHFNTRYDPTQEEEYSPLWFGCCWGRRRRRAASKSSSSQYEVVKNVDHLWRPELSSSYNVNDIQTKREERHLYLGTWIAEVSLAHPTGGLLRTFLTMEALTRDIAQAQALVAILTHEQEQATRQLQEWTPPGGKQRVKRPKSSFHVADERLLQATRKKLEHLQTALSKKTDKLNVTSVQTCNLNACACAFIVFNTLESRRRCLQDYRRSTQWWTRVFQPQSLRFRHEIPLIVVPAPEPSNILWENLEVSPRSRRLRRAFTNSVTCLLLVVSGVIISAAQSAQQTFKDKAPPPGFCEATLPAIFDARMDFLTTNLTWKLEWDPNASCSVGSHGERRYHVAYSNGIIKNLSVENPALPLADLHRCIDPCISDKSTLTCHTLPCFNGSLRQQPGQECATYPARQQLDCLCIAELAASVTKFGLLRGPHRLWTFMVPCRDFLTDYVVKNVLIVVASVVVVMVNFVLKTTLRVFATFERHTSESAKAASMALKLFWTQFLNTAIIVLVVNAALSVHHVPLLKDIFRGKYRDFEREWYPTVGVGITMTMVLNALFPPGGLLIYLGIVTPLKRSLTRRRIRTQEAMTALYTGPRFDLALRYPMLLNSVVVTLLFCGGTPVLLFIAAFTCLSTYWLDKWSIGAYYTVQTTYDQALGETVLTVVPWSLLLHCGFSSWMYGNPELLQAPQWDLAWLVTFLHLHLHSNAEGWSQMIVAKLTRWDPFGEHGIVFKVLHLPVLLMFFLFVLLLSGIILTLVYSRVVQPLFQRLCCVCQRSNAVHPWTATSLTVLKARERKPHGYGAKIAAADGDEPREIQFSDIVAPAFTDVFRKTIQPTVCPDGKLGFQRDVNCPSQLVRLWQEETLSNGFVRQKGQLMRTWEAIHAPVTTYAIQANPKYRLAVAELVAAVKRAQNENNTKDALPLK